MLTLYEHPLSPYSQKVKIALREKGIAFTLKYPEGIGTGASGGAFAAASPRAEVPALIDGETAIFDSTIILEYIEDKWPTPSLQPAGAAERARVRMIEEIVDTHYEAVNWGLGELHWFKRAEGDLAETLDANAAEQVRGFFAWLEGQLGDRVWFNGEAFGRGDLCVAPFVGASRVWGHTPAPGSKLAAWVERSGALPSVGQTLAESFAFDRGASNVAQMVAQGLFKREYRDHRLEWMIRSGGIEVVLKGLAADNIRFAPAFG
jgi:glutathione S-transferase/RNA polymerase-associated protein